MPNIADHPSKRTTKSLLIGDSTSGKTGALASLAAAGFKLRILDWDNGLDILRDYLTNPESPYVKQNPKCAENVSFVTLTDKMKNINGTLQVAKSEAWTRTMKLMMNWEDGDQKLGPVASWDEDTFLVGDSLTFLSRHAENFDHFMNGNLGKNLTQNEGRRAVGRSQNLIKQFLDMLYDDNLKCNVLLLSHITAVTEAGGAPGGEGQANLSSQGYPSAVGRALSPQIPRWFNNMLVVKAIPVGTKFKRIISTVPQYVNGQVVSVKTSAPLRVKPEYPLETGLADFIRDLRGESPST